MKLVIAGSRTFINREKVLELIDFSIQASGLLPSTVLCGCAKGVDTIGAEWAHARGINIEYMPANWAKEGRKAGPLRNRKMAKLCDEVLIIRRADSRGSASMKAEAEALGKVVHDYVIPKAQAAAFEKSSRRRT